MTRDILSGGGSLAILPPGLASALGQRVMGAGNLLTYTGSVGGLGSGSVIKPTDQKNTHSTNAK